MKENRSRFAHKSLLKEGREDLKQDSPPNDYQFLTLKYGKYMDQSKKNDPPSRFEPSTDLGLREESDQNLDGSSTDGVDEEQLVTNKLNSKNTSVPGKRKKKRVKGKKKSEKDHMATF